MNSTHAELMSGIFRDGHEQLTQVLRHAAEEIGLGAVHAQTPQHTLEPPWTGRFQALGQTAEFQAAAIRCASALYDEAVDWCRKLGFQSQRAAALMFDIKVQNGGIGPNTLTLIESDFAALAPGDRDVVEVAKMRKTANRIAGSANSRWRETVRSRKLAIANGTGIVNGVHYDLAAQFGITMAAWTEA